MKNLLLTLIVVVGVGGTQSLYGAKSAPCKCYCAVKCGPRDMKPGDRPRNVKVKIKDRHGKTVERNAVFCADRDEAIYKKNPRKCKITEEVLEQLTCVPQD